MRFRLAAIAISGCLLASEARAQEHPVRRVANIVSVAVEEYAKGVDSRGRMISEVEYQEAADFLADAKQMRDVSPATMYRITSVGIAGTPMTGFAGALTPDQRWSIVSYLISRRATSAQLAEGEGLFTQRCVQCHGALGAGDGAFARSLSRLPQEIGSLAWQA